MKANLYNKTTFTEDRTFTKPMAETENGDHYPVFSPLLRDEMVGEQTGKVLTIKGVATFVLESQMDTFKNLYNPRKFVY